jgi:cell division protein FtsN
VIGVLIGLVLGVLIALGVAWFLNKTPLPFQNKGLKPAGEKAEHGTPAENGAAVEAAPAPLPGKPGDKPMERPRCDFYKMLPSGEEAAPAPAPAEKTERVESAPTEILFLQAGSFQKPEDADNLRAKLALLGLDASVQPVNIPEKGTLHRVRIGPFKKPEEMNRARSLLAENGIQARLVKAKDGASN